MEKMKRVVLSIILFLISMFAYSYEKSDEFLKDNNLEYLKIRNEDNKAYLDIYLGMTKNEIEGLGYVLKNNYDEFS